MQQDMEFLAFPLVFPHGIRYNEAMNYEITVTAASGVESVTKRELVRLGVKEPRALSGAITFPGDDLLVARCNLFLRTADRVYIGAGSFKAETFDQLFDGAAAIEWEAFLPPDAQILVDGKSVKSKLFALSACQSVIKKAILKRLSRAYKRTDFPETGARFMVEFSILKDVVRLYLNTSGAGLHKRGYRDLVGRAPLKETLAASLLLLSDFYHARPFADPFCGSGTLVIEGARIALNIASGINRSFDYRNWDFFDPNAYNLALEEARDTECRSRKLDFIGSDLDPQAIRLARRHAERAGVGGAVRFEIKDVRDFKSDRRDGVIVTNPPYGERLLDVREAQELYRALGTACRRLDHWSVFVLTSAPAFESHFGRKADKNRKLYNSNKECRYYMYYHRKEERE